MVAQIDAGLRAGPRTWFGTTIIETLFLYMA